MATAMDLPFGANPKLRNVNLEAHEMKVLSDAAQQEDQSTSVEDVAGATPDNSSVAIISQSVNSSGSVSNGRLVTMMGTIKRGQKVGETVEVQLQLTEKEMNKLHQSTNALDEEDKDRDDACIWGLDKGLHIIVLTILFIPFAFIMSMGMAAYIGTIAWYNVYLNLSEERTVWHKVFLCPLLILTFPVFIVLTAVCIGLYAAVIQISWFCSSWRRAMRDQEKGFFGWLCHAIGVPQCAPYEVVVLDEPNPLPEPSQTETTHNLSSA